MRASGGMRSAPSRVLAVLATAVALVACGSQAGSLGEVGTYADAGAGTSGFASGADASTDVRVAVAPASQTICPGQCVDLSASTAGGTPPYAYAWTGGGVTSSAASLHACPTTTTTYTVTASDSSGQRGELARPDAKGSATAEVTVGATCASASDAGAVPPPPRFAHELCSVRWPLTSAPPNLLTEIENQNVVASTDAAGNILLAVTFNGTLTANGTKVTTQGTSDTLVAKFDPQCHFQWMKDFGAVGAGIVVTSVASDAALDVIVGGTFNGNIDFGFGAQPGGGTFSPQVFVVALTASGAPLWAGREHVGVFLGLASDSKGEVVFAFDGTLADFDAGTSMNPSFWGTARLNATGAMVSLVNDGALGLFSDMGANPNVGMSATGTVVVAGSANSIVTDAGEMTYVGEVAETAPDGTPLWSVQLSAPPPPAHFTSATPSSVAAAVDPAGDAFVLNAWQWLDNDTGNAIAINPGNVARVSAAGHVVWTATTTDDVQPAAAFSVGPWLALDAADDIFVGGTLTGSATFGAVGTVTSAGPEDAAFAVYDASGVLRSAGTWGAPGEDTSLGSIAADGSAILLAGTASSGAGTDVFVVTVGW
jgi:hypothetical protein